MTIHPKFFHATRLSRIPLLTGLAASLGLLFASPSKAETNPIRVTVVGASDVATPTNYGTPNFPVYLAQMLGYGYEVTNAGASGTTMMKTGNAPYWTTQQYLSSLSSSPDIVIIMLGSNDSKPYNWSHKEDYKPAYLDLIAQYRNLPTHPRIYLNTLLTVYGNGNFDITDPIVTGEIVPLIKQIGMETNSPVFDINAATKNMPENFPDNVHPNIEGAKVVAQTTFNGLMSVGEPAPLVNLALNRPVTFSSVADNSPASNAVDGDFGTRWSSGYTDNEWISVDLGAVTAFTDVYLNWEAAYGLAYKVQVSNDATAWTDIYSTTSGDGGIDHISAQASARYVRMLGVDRATIYGYSLWDIGVVNAVPEPGPISLLGAGLLFLAFAGWRRIRRSEG